MGEGKAVNFWLIEQYWLRGCPPAFGLLLDAAAPSTPSARAA
jgi:hypothetical protein